MPIIYPNGNPLSNKEWSVGITKTFETEQPETKVCMHLFTDLIVTVEGSSPSLVNAAINTLLNA